VEWEYAGGLRRAPGPIPLPLRVDGDAAADGNKKGAFSRAPFLFSRISGNRHSSFGGHSGDGSVSASGFAPHAATSEARRAEITRYRYVKKLRLDFIRTPSI